MLVGHSAGGQLALWAGKRAQLPVVALAPVSDVRDSVARTGPDGPPARFMAPEHFADGSPLELLPLGVPQIVIHGTEDDSVPYEMSERYVEAAARRGRAASPSRAPATSSRSTRSPRSGRRSGPRSSACSELPGQPLSLADRVALEQHRSGLPGELGRGTGPCEGERRHVGQLREVWQHVLQSLGS